MIDWYNGKGPGLETEKAYKMLKKKTSKTVIVAVIDSGVDIEHKDLQGKIWKNEDENYMSTNKEQLVPRH